MPLKPRGVLIRATTCIAIQASRCVVACFAYSLHLYFYNLNKQEGGGVIATLPLFNAHAMASAALLIYAKGRNELGLK